MLACGIDAVEFRCVLCVDDEHVVCELFDLWRAIRVLHFPVNVRICVAFECVDTDLAGSRVDVASHDFFFSVS